MKVEDKAIDRFRGCLIGLTIGDAIGTTVEFKARGTFEPVTNMVGGGPFDLKAGQWTDDTSMALCLAESLLISNGFDADDLMQRFCKWWDEGYLSSTGECFDIGTTVSEALCLLHPCSSCGILLPQTSSTLHPKRSNEGNT